MKKVALLAAAAAMFATPAMAGGGHVGVSYGSTDTGLSSELETWQGEGAYGASNGQLGFQLDGSFGEGELGPLGFEHWRAIGHVFWDGGAWRLGGVLGVTSFTTDVIVTEIELEENIYGVEGTYDVGANTVLGASYTLGETEYVISDIEQLDTWNFDASLRHYFSENLSVEGVLGVGSIDFGDGKADTATYGLSAEWRPFSAPVSLRASWTRLEGEMDIEDAETLSFGVRWNFAGSLRERDEATPFRTRTPLYHRSYGIE